MFNNSPGTNTIVKIVVPDPASGSTGTTFFQINNLPTTPGVTGQVYNTGDGVLRIT
jgi:hypothetical protein